MIVVNARNPELPEPQHNNLWLLVGGDADHNGAKAYFLGPDRDIHGDDAAGANLRAVLDRYDNAISGKDARAALDTYRRTAR